ncbi:MAG: FHIPEP family type III secretion protein, partial [Planctomycetota bacterium]
FVERGGQGTTVNMPARVASELSARVIETLRPVTDAGHPPVVIASPQVRAVVKQMLEPHLPGAAVLGYNEVVSEMEVRALGLVTAPEEPGSGGAGQGSSPAFAAA